MSLDPKQRNALVGVGVALCLIVSAQKIYSFYEATIPPFKVGECFVIHDAVGDIHFKVLSNNRLNSESTAVGTVDMGLAKVEIPVKGSFDELRAAGATKEDCQ